MAVGLAPAIAAKVLDALGNNVSFVNAEVWVQLHTSDPGAAGTSGIAVNATRKQAGFSLATSGTMTNDTVLTWVNVPAGEDYSHYTAWSASAAGTFLFSGIITAAAVVVGDAFQVALGDLDLSLTIAA